MAATTPARAQQKPLIVEHGRYTIHLLLKPVGTEEYTVSQSGLDHSQLITTSSIADRGNQRTISATLDLAAAFAPVSLDEHIARTNTDGTSSNETVSSGFPGRTIPAAPSAFVAMPAALQMMMMRYWTAHHQQLPPPPVYRSGPRALPIEIRLVGHEALYTKAGMVRLTRYTVANLVFGREILWMNDSNRLAAVMTFAGGLPQEEVLDQYQAVAGQLFYSAVQQEMLDLADLTREVPPETSGAYAIVGARLIDGTGSAPVENSTVVIKDGRIVSAGTAPAPAGMRIIHAEGKSLLPGLWDMHVHYSGVEFGPALLAAGITTARDCGGEFGFLTEVRKQIDEKHALGPKLLLAGLIDSGGPLAFGWIDANTPGEAVRAVDTYADAHFDQIKVYTQVKPAVLQAITAEAHRRGLTVTGHVPAAIDAFEAIADGMDQINHLQFVVRAMSEPSEPGSTVPLDVNSPHAQRLIALLKEHHTVIDPTDSWAEMADHPRNIPIASFEPGILAAPYPVSARLQSLGSPATDEPKFREHMETNRKVIAALSQAGIPIVAGTDTGLPGYGLDRELELYVQAGLSPMAAIQAATIVPARAMHLDARSGSIEPGKIANMVLIDGNPLANIGDIRRVSKVIKEGRMYDSGKLARSVGYTR